MELLSSTLLVALVVTGLVLLLLDTRKPAHFPPGPRWLPLLGSLWAVYSLVRRLGLTHLAWNQLATEYGPLVGLRLGLDRIVLVSNYSLAREVLTREDAEGRPDGFLFRLRAFGKRLGVVFTDGSFGQEQRRFVMRHLREQGLGRSAMLDRITDETRQFVDCLYALYPEGPVDVRRVATFSVLNSLWGMLAGRRFDIGDARLSHLLGLIRRSFSLQDMTGGLLNQLPFIRFLAPRRSNYLQNVEIIDAIYSFLSETIEEHKKTLDKENIRDFIDAFLLEIEKNENNSKSTFSEEQLRVLLLDLFMAGSDTTSNAVAFAVLYMLHYPWVQDRLAEEIERVVGSSHAPNLQDRASMPYTEAVIMEVLRFTNIATVTIPHRAKRAVSIGQHVLPKDVTILVNLYSVHMDESHWGDPHNFRPERFLDSDDKVVSDDWLIPFGLGRRRCLGETLARPMIFLLFTSLLYHFRVEPEHAQGPLPSLAPVDGAVLAPQPFTCRLLPRRSPPKS